MIVVKVEKIESNFKVVVRQGDESVARQESVKAAISAEEARLSEVAAGQSEAVAIDNATQTGQDAAAALASRNQAASSASDAAGSAFDANASAVASEDAKGLAVDAQGVSSTQAQNSSTSAGQSAQSALNAEIAKNEILNKAQINLTTLGRILRADGTLFESISEVEFLRNKDAFSKSAVGAFSQINRAFAWDSFIRPNTTIENGLGISDSGQVWQQLGSIPRMYIQSNSAGRDFGTFGCSVIERTVFTGNAPILDGNLLLKISGFDSAGTFGIGVIFAVDQNNFLTCYKNGSQFAIAKTILGITTTLSFFNISGANNVTGFEMSVTFIRNVFNQSVSISLDSDFIAAPSGVTITGEWNVFGANANLIRYVGIVSGSAINLRTFYSFYAKNLF